MAAFGTPQLSFATDAAPRVVAAQVTGAAKCTRFRNRQESLCYLSWLVAWSGSFLLVGLVGLLLVAPLAPIELGGRAGLGATEGEATDLSMAELLADNEVDQVTPTEIEQVETVEIPDPVEVNLEIEEVPELTEALDVEDLFTIPTAPKIETAMRPVDPAKPKPKPRSTAQPRSSRAASPNAMAGGTTGAGGGNGGTGTQGAGAGGKSKTPQPPYPPGARSRGVQGKVYFSIRINLMGKVESAVVTSSECTNGGFTSADHEYLSSYIRRNWVLSSAYYGQTRSLPIRFVLK